MNNTKAERFVRVAEARTNKAIDIIRLLGNLSNTNVYEYREEDIEKIFNAIEEEISSARARFDASDRAKKRFTLE